MEQPQQQRHCNVRITGTFKLSVFDASGALLSCYEDANLVVDSGKTGLALMLAGNALASSGQKIITNIGFGSNGVAPVNTDTALTGLFSKTVDAMSLATSTILQVDWTLDLTENNGATIREFGLLTDDGTLFARKVRGTDIVKTSDIRLVGSWFISFNN